MQPSFLRGMRQDIHKKEYKKRNRINSFFKRAGDGNRTHVSSLEGWCSTIELHPQMIGTDFFLCLVDCRASLTKRILQESRRKVNPFFKKN